MRTRGEELGRMAAEKDFAIDKRINCVNHRMTKYFISGYYRTMKRLLEQEAERKLRESMGAWFMFADRKAKRV